MDTETIETEAVADATPDTTKRPMRGTAIAWGIFLLVAAAIAWIARSVRFDELSPTTVIWNIVVVGAILVAIGLIGAIVRAVTNKS